MSDIEKRRIFVGPADRPDSKPRTVEGVAVAAHVPGTVLKSTSSGLENSDIAATVFGSPLIVADKDSLRQKSVDDAWVINENCVGVRAAPGDILNVLVATGQTLAVDTALTRNGAGLLTTATTDGTHEIVAYADEVITTSGTQLVRVRAA